MAPEPDDRLEDVLDAWQEAFDRGVDLSASTLCRARNCPDLAPEAGRRIADLRRVARLGRGAVRESRPADGTWPAPQWGQVGEYEVVRELGRGGMGIVLLPGTRSSAAWSRSKSSSRS